MKSDILCLYEGSRSLLGQGRAEAYESYSSWSRLRIRLDVAGVETTDGTSQSNSSPRVIVCEMKLKSMVETGEMDEIQ